MTFLKTRFKLKKELTTKDLERLSRFPLFTDFAPSFEGQVLVVEYDASRIHEAEVLAQVRRPGVPVEPCNPFPRVDLITPANSAISRGRRRVFPRSIRKQNSSALGTARRFAILPGDSL